MDYNKIKDTFLSKNIKVKGVLKKIRENYPGERGITENGFKASIDNGTIRVRVLELISRELNVKMSYWWPDYDIRDYHTNDEFRDFPQKYFSRLEEDLKHFQELYEKSEENKKRDQKTIDELREDKVRLLKRIDELNLKLGIKKDHISG